MKRILLATVAVAVLGAATSASAADLAARPYTKAPPIVVAVYDWTGFYIGANGGWGSSHKCWDLISRSTGTASDDGCHNADGGVAGGQIGYRWQSSAWVFGLEAQGDWADLKGSSGSLLSPVIGLRSKIDAFGLFTGQVGYAWNSALLYVKGGAAVTSDKYDRYLLASGATTASAKETRWGGTVGVGLEYGFTPNWSVAIEYDHLFMGSRNNDFYSASGILSQTERVKQDVDLVTARINYKWGGPVVAKY
ncbi:outer membrane immunogenic protein [Nitrobacteraceae bacterium AZCC 2146]